MTNYIELVDSRAVEVTAAGWTETRKYHADTSDTEAAAAGIVAIGTPHPTISGIAVTQVSAEPIDSKGCHVSVVYGCDDDDRLANAYGEVIEWDLATSQVHITNVASAGDQRHYPTGAPGGTAIGVDGDDVQGVDVYRPAVSLTIRKRVSVEPNATYRATLFGLLGKTNNSHFMGCEIGEALFIGARISKTDAVRWEIEFNFLVAKSAGTTSYAGIDGGTISISMPGAWDYVWFRHTQRKIDDAISSGIASVHVAKVYASGAFSGLQIGQAFTNP